MSIVFLRWFQVPVPIFVSNRVSSVRCIDNSALAEYVVCFFFEYPLIFSSPSLSRHPMKLSATPVLKGFWILHVKMGVSNSICACLCLGLTACFCSRTPLCHFPVIPHHSICRIMKYLINSQTEISALFG